MLATVVLPCLNNQETLERALQSLNSQTMRRQLQILVVDNGSTDGSHELAMAFADRTAQVATRGSAHARNLGLALTETAYMLTLDADCRPVRPDWAERHLAAMSAQPVDVIAGGGSLIPDPTTDWWANRPEVTPHSPLIKGQLLYAVGGNACYRTQPVKRLGGFPAFGADDAALGIVARRCGYRFARVDDAPVYHANCRGWHGYYRQMRKIGAYAAELTGPPAQWNRYAFDRIRHLGSTARFLANGDLREWFAGSMRAVAQTQGALSVWKAMGWRAKAGLIA